MNVTSNMPTAIYDSIFFLFNKFRPSLKDSN
jgi:hypothetical protein